MNWFEEQLETRRRLDEEELENAYARLAASVIGGDQAPRFSLDDAAAADNAIAAVLAHYGIKPAQIPDGISDPNERVDYAIRPTGVMKRTVRLEDAWWKDATGAYLAALEDGTPVAVVPHRIHGYAYVNPATHSKVTINKKTAKNLRPEALCFYRPLPQRELSLRDVGSFMMHALDTGDYALVLMATLVSTVIGFMPAMANNLLFSRIIPADMPSLIAPIGALLLGMTLSQALINITKSVILNRLNTKLEVQMEAATYARILLLPPSFFKDYAAGDLANRSMAMKNLVSVFAQVMIGAGLSGVFGLAYIGQVMAYAPALVVPAILVIAAEVIASILLVRATIRFNREQMMASTKLSGLTPALLHGIQKIKLSGAERRAFSHWVQNYAEVSEASYHRPALMLAAPSLVPLIGSLGTIAFYYLAANANMTIAHYMAFNTAFGSVSGAVMILANSSTILASVRPLLEMVEPVMKTVPEALSNQRQVTQVSGGIEINNLSFRYGERLPLILDDISLHVRRGEYVAIVGRTGCGKSTLMRLLLGFERPTKGAIYYGGNDISTVDIRSLRKHIGVVMQSGSLFQGDLFTNIIVANPTATLDDAWEAAEIAGIADDIRRMPMGMQTLVSEGGGGLSGGQRQRILIARAVCGKPRIIMFDEATSALDNITQRHVSEALEGLSCTRIVIAHRLSTIRNANRIIMIEGGHIVEDGSYDQLVARGGQFAELVKRQQLEGE